MGQELTVLNVKAIGLSRLKVEFVNDDTAALILTNTNNKQSSYLIDPHGLGMLLEELLTLAAIWAEHPEMKVERLSGDSQAMAATKFSIQKGRNDGEAALSVWLDKLLLTFLIPMDQVIQASASVIKIVEPTSRKNPH